MILHAAVTFSVDAPPPVLGQDNDEILTSLGLSSEEIKNLAEEGVL